jgi:hypothetical protein
MLFNFVYVFLLCHGHQNISARHVAIFGVISLRTGTQQ